VTHLGDTGVLHALGVMAVGLVHVMTIPVDPGPFVPVSASGSPLAPSFPVRLDTPTMRAAWVKFIP
jgi:hypothetical protein